MRRLKKHFRWENQVRKIKKHVDDDNTKQSKAGNIK